MAVDIRTRIGRLLHLSPVLGTIALSSDHTTPDGRSSTGVSTAEAKALVKAAEGHLIDAFRMLSTLMKDEPALAPETRAYLTELSTHSDSTLHRKLVTKEGFHHLREACRAHIHAALSDELGDYGGDHEMAQVGGSIKSFFKGVGHWFGHTATQAVNGIKKTVGDVLSLPDSAARGLSTVMSHPFETAQSVSMLADSAGNLATGVGNLASGAGSLVGSIAPMAALA